MRSTPLLKHLPPDPHHRSLPAKAGDAVGADDAVQLQSAGDGQLNKAPARAAHVGG